MTTKAPKKLGLLESISQKFKSIVNNSEAPSETSRKPLSKTNQPIPSKDVEKPEITPNNFKLGSSEKLSLHSFFTNEQDKSPSARLLNSSVKSLHTSKISKIDRRKGDLGLDILPESFTDLPIPKEYALMSEVGILNSHLRKKDQSKRDLKLTVKTNLAFPSKSGSLSKINMDLTLHDTQHLSSSPTNMKRGVSFAKRLVEFDEDKSIQKDSKIEHQQILDTGSIVSTVNMTKTNPNSPTASILRKNRSSLLVNGGKDFDHVDLTIGPISKKLSTFDRNPMYKSVEMSVLEPKKGDDASLDSQEFGESKKVRLSNLTKNQNTFHSQSLSIPSDLPKSELKSLKAQKRKQSIEKFKIKIKRSFSFLSSLTILLIVTFIVLGTIASVIAYPFENMQLQKWIGQFFHGASLSLMCSFASHLVLKKHQEITHQEQIKNAHPKKKHQYDTPATNKIILNRVFCIFLAVVAGLLLVGTKHYFSSTLNNSYSFVLIEMCIILINLIFCLIYCSLKNYFKRQTQKNKQEAVHTKGLFPIPVYKNFLNDIRSTRSIFTDPNGPQIQSPTQAPLCLKEQTAPSSKDEGVDKFTPLKPVTIIPLIKIVGANLLLVISYAQFVAIVALVKLYQNILTKDPIYPVFLLFVLSPIATYIFTKTLHTIDRIFALSIDSYAHYLTSPFEAIFYRLALFYVGEMKYIWIMMVCKAFYKIVIYLLLGRQIEFLRVKFTKFFLAKCTKPEEEPDNYLFQHINRIQNKLNAPDPLQTFRPKKTDGENETQQDSDNKKETQKDIKEVINNSFIFRFAFITLHDILCSAILLGLILVPEQLNHHHQYFKNLSYAAQNYYVKGTWMDLSLDAALFAVINLTLLACNCYRKINVIQLSKTFFKRYFLPYSLTSLTMFATFLFLAHIMW